MRRTILAFAVLMVMAADVAAEEYLAILECKVEQEADWSLYRISGSDAAPSFQMWLPQKLRWSRNWCELDGDHGQYKWRHACDFSSAAYLVSRKFSAWDSEGSLYGTGAWEINRINGIYEESEFSLKKGEHKLGEPSLGYCRKAEEPKVPEAQF